MKLQYRSIIVFIMVLFPLISESKEMSFIFEGEVTANAYSDFITEVLAKLETKTKNQWVTVRLLS